MAIFLFSLFIFLTPEPSNPIAQWHTEFETAQAEALSEEKFILMVFSGSDWCKPCIRLKQEVFQTHDFQQYASEHLSLLNVDFPRRKKHQVADEVQQYRNSLAEKYNPTGLFPKVLLLDPDGKFRQEINYKGGGLTAFLDEIKD